MLTPQLSLVLTVPIQEGWPGWVDLGGWLHTAHITGHNALLLNVAGILPPLNHSHATWWRKNTNLWQETYRATV